MGEVPIPAGATSGPGGGGGSASRFIAVDRPRSARSFFVPQGHRLYVVFDDRRAANMALFEWTGGMPLSQGAWMFDGPEGAAALDPDLAVGRWALLSRMFAFVFSSNVEFVRALSSAVRRGSTVLALHVPNRHVAEDAARGMRWLGGHSVAYAMHGNFVPLTP